MPTTTNFGWTTPADTDLVSAGASAMRTLGSAIDTSMGDLKGGTAGQMLIKATGTDMDFSWVDRGWNVLDTKTLTGASVDSTFSTDYSDLRIYLKDAICATSAATIRLRLGSSGTVDTGNNYYTGGGGASSFISLVTVSTGTPTQQGLIEIPNYVDTTPDVKFVDVTGFSNTTNYAKTLHIWNAGAVSTNIVRVYPSSGNWTSGTLVVLGRK